MFLEDFLETFRDRGRSVPRAKYATLVFLERHVQAPLITAGIHVPAPAAGKKAVRGQATPLQPLMARHVRLAFQADLAAGSWRTMATALAVIATVKPLRFAHINRSRPLARTGFWMTFWASKGKARSETGEREGFRWSIALAEPILHLACTTVWDQWHLLAQSASRKGNDLPEFLGFDIKTGMEFSLGDFNKILEDITREALCKHNKLPVTSYSLRRVPPGLLQMRAAPWEQRLALGGWRMGTLQAANLMPLRYSGEKFNEELKVCAVQARMTALWADHNATWAEARVWWATQQPDLAPSWERSFQQDLLGALSVQPEPSLALGVDKLIAALGAGKIQEEEFRVASEPSVPQAVAHASSPRRKRSAKAVEGPCTWICSVHARGVMHRCIDGRPLCHKKKATAQANLSKGARMYTTHEEAVAVVMLENRTWCSVCFSSRA
jgi:hypothetical protein